MNRKTLATLTVFASLLISTAVLSNLNLKPTYAQTSSSIDVKVDHQMTVHDGGHVTLTDEVMLSQSNVSAPLLQTFRIGFPYKYKANIYNVFAYESSNPQNKFPITLDVGLGSIGFYGVEVDFKTDLDLNQLSSFNFTTVFELARLITNSAGQGTTFDLDVPVYPSLTQQASSVRTTVILPSNANFTRSSHEFNQTQPRVLTLLKEPLEPLTAEQGTVSFVAVGQFFLLEVNEVNRQLVLNQWEEILVSDFYTIMNRALIDANNITVLLPGDAVGVSARDDLQNTLDVRTGKRGASATATFTLKTSIKTNQTAHVLISFKLPWKNHVSQNGLTNYNLRFSLFEPINLTLARLIVAVDLPEGAEFQSSNSTSQVNLVENGAYQQTPVFTVSNVSSFQDLGLAVDYSHVVFWAAFRPTLWTGALVVIVGAIALIWQTQRAPGLVPTALPIRTDELRDYVKTYEEERKLRRERESLEEQARKGKILRRLYRVRSRTLDSRLAVLSRDLAALREKIRRAGPRYGEMMRQIEVAETELQGIDADIRRTEARYRRGEIAAAAYHKLLEDAYRRRDRAKTNIDGVLLRLREELG